MDMATEPSKDESLSTPPKNQTGPKVSDEFALVTVCFEYSMFMTLIVVANVGIELDPIISKLGVVIELLKLFLAMHLATHPPKEYKFMGREMRCVADILPVGFAMALAYIYPYHMGYVVVLSCWTVHCYILVRLWWGVYNLVGFWDILVTMPVQISSYWFVAPKIANMDHPLVLFAMALGFWTTISIYRTRTSSGHHLPLISEKYAVLPDC
ncbi:unnamed protein product [Cuscuta campestris]|uniref:Uncharacterized protein n=1 Tax=Cuscuta campestris TaxID=132261 RepID=A0A484L948_9ASTE|nr:unnamed protein product [Cuscuta campestris]